MFVLQGLTEHAEQLKKEAREEARRVESINQAICDRLVQNEVSHCCSTMVYELARQDNNGDIQEAVWQLAYRNEWQEPGEWWVDADADREALEEAADWMGRSDINELTDEQLREFIKEAVTDDDAWEAFGHNFELDPHQHEAFEHWIVSGFLAEKLEAKGAIIGELFDFTIWGRCTTGQAISMDGIIREIAHEMEILAGQRHSWEENHARRCCLCHQPENKRG